MSEQNARAMAIAEQVAAGCLIWDKRDFDFDKAATIIASALSATADTARAQGREERETLRLALQKADEAIVAGQACRSEGEFARWMHDSQSARPTAVLLRARATPGDTP